MKLSLFLKRHSRIFLYLAVVLFHFSLLFLISFPQVRGELSSSYEKHSFQIVDRKRAFPDESKATRNVTKRKIVPLPNLEGDRKEKIEIVETVDQGEQEKSKKEEVETAIPVSEEADEYFPQHKITKAPRIPVSQVRSRLRYPPRALRERVEGIVYVQLYIDSHGIVKKVEILKEPVGYGFGDAAREAMIGVRCTPGKIDNRSVAVVFRYPIRFVLQ